MMAVPLEYKSYCIDLMRQSKKLQCAQGVFTQRQGKGLHFQCEIKAAASILTRRSFVQTVSQKIAHFGASYWEKRNLKAKST